VAFSPPSADLWPYFDTLFDRDESTCFSMHEKGTAVYPVRSWEERTWTNFLCLNPLHPLVDNNPTKEFHSADKPRRADCNVVNFRNILIEMDRISVPEQQDFMKVAGIPYSTACFSGGKSIHYVISLKYPFHDRPHYERFVKRIYDALNEVSYGLVDPANKNPSRFTRFPNARRGGAGGPVQKLLEVNGRVENAALEAWCFSKLGEKKEPPKPNPYVPYAASVLPGKQPLSGWTLNFMTFGAGPGHRNRSLFRAACDFASKGYSKEEARAKLHAVTDLPNDEIERTIDSAFARATPRNS